MDKNISIEQLLNQPENNEIISKKSSPVIALIYITCGAMLFIASAFFKESTSAMLFPITITLATILCISGTLKLAFRKKKYFFKTNSQEIKIKEYLFNIKERDKLVRMIENKDFHEIDKLENTIQDSLKLKIASTADFSYCVAQVVVFVPYEYVNATEAIKIPTEKAALLIPKMLKTYK